MFDPNTGFGEMDDQLSSVAANLEPSQFLKCGFDFAGWSTNQNGGPTTYQDESSFPFVDAETRLYAQWNSTGFIGNRVKTDVIWSPVNGNSGSTAFANGTVLTMSVNPVSGELYAGGSFTNAAGIAEADYIAKWDGTSWSALGSSGSADGALAHGPESDGASGVFDIAFDSVGNLFVTGKFVTSGGASHLAKWDGSGWSSVGTGLEFNAAGRAIAIDSRNRLYLGGQFTDVAGDSAVDYLAMWDGAAWSGVGNSGINRFVRSIEIGLSDSVYVGTWSNNIGGIAEADYIAKWNGSVWSALGGTLSGNGQLTDMPRSITVDTRSGADIVYVGNLSSRILDVNGTSVNTGNFIKWDGTQWGRALPDVFISDSYVTDVALAPGGGLVVGGWFYATDNDYEDACNTNQKSLAYFDGTNTFGLGLNGSDPSFDGQIDSVVIKDGNLIVGGSFRSAGGNSSASRIAMTNISFAQSGGGDVPTVPTPVTPEVPTPVTPEVPTPITPEVPTPVTPEVPQPPQAPIDPPPSVGQLTLPPLTPGVANSGQISGVSVDQLQSVTIGGKPATLTADGATSTNLLVPALAPGVYDVTYTLANGQTGVIAGGLTVPATSELPVGVASVTENPVAATVSVALPVDTSSDPSRVAALQIFDAKGKLVQTLTQPVGANATDATFAIPENLVGYKVVAFTQNQFGVSADAPISAALIEVVAPVARAANGNALIAGTVVAPAISFAPDSAALPKSSTASIQAAAAFVKTNGGKLVITGFINPSSVSASVAQKLATKRALAVAVALRKLGVNVWMNYSGAGAFNGASSPKANRKAVISWVPNGL
jgi:outer membrane protein OmpA-like peptidoglycan-associated protein